MRRVAASIGAAALLLTWSSSAASAAPIETVIEGEVLQLVSVQDAAAMSTMRPGQPVSWDVGVSSTEPAGTIDVTLDVVDVATGAYRATVEVCGERWSDAGCETDAVVVLDTALVEGETARLARQDAAATAWYRVEVELLAPRGGASANLRLTAAGFGEVLGEGGEAEVPGVPSPGDDAAGLPPTGARIAWYGLLAVLAVGIGVLVARVPGRVDGAPR